MLADFVRLLIEIIGFIWPMHIVPQYERSGRYWLGRYRRDVGPGIYGKIPWFMRFVDVTVTPYPVTTGRMDITLVDGKSLSFDATATIQVTDVDKALNGIDSFHTAATLKVAAILATRLAQLEAEKLAPENRRELLRKLRDWVNAETQDFGVKCLDVAFNSFVVNLRTYRLLTDSSAPQTSFVG